MALACTVKELRKELTDIGNQLLKPPSKVDELLDKLDRAESLLSKVGQDYPISIQYALLPLMKALIDNSLLEHSDINVKISVVSCISEVSRFTAPAAPYNDKIMENFFKLVAVAFEKLSDASSCCYTKAIRILENCARVRFCVLLLDLKCEALLIEIFQIFLNTIRVDHPNTVYKYMENIMTWIMLESDDISPELLRPILAALKRGNQHASPLSSKLGEKVLWNSSPKVKPYLREAVKVMNIKFEDYADIVASLCEDALNVELREAAMDALHLIEGGLSADGISELVLENTNNSNAMPKEDHSLRTFERCDQIEQSKKAGGKLDVQRYKLNAAGNVQPANDADSEETASDNVVGKMKEAISDKVEGQNDKIIFEKHGNAEVGGEVSISSDAIILEDNDGNFSAKGAKTERKRKRAPKQNEESEKRSREKNKGEELVGLKIKVWWPLDRRFYEGVVSSYDSSKNKHKVVYTDGDVENLNLRREIWELVDDDALTGKEQKADA